MVLQYFVENGRRRTNSCGEYVRFVRGLRCERVEFVTSTKEKREREESEPCSLRARVTLGLDCATTQYDVAV